jgi:hypothetical protein
MGLFDAHVDVLQNIEFAIVNVYRERPLLVDYSVMRSLEALIGLYRAESRGHTPKAISLDKGASCKTPLGMSVCSVDRPFCGRFYRLK